MTNVIFTGRGNDAFGMFQTRDGFWEPMARDAGYTVADKVQWSSDILVASTTTTKKADAARRLGADVMTYREFQVHCTNNSIANRSGGRGRSPFDDARRAVDPGSGNRIDRSNPAGRVPTRAYIVESRPDDDGYAWRLEASFATEDGAKFAFDQHCANRQRRQWRICRVEGDEGTPIRNYRPDHPVVDGPMPEPARPVTNAIDAEHAKRAISWED